MTFHASKDEDRISLSRRMVIFLKLRQDKFGAQPGELIITEISVMTAPLVISRRGNHASPDRIQMDVSGQLKQVIVSIDQNRLIAPLKQVSAPILAIIHPARIPEGQVMHPFGERLLPYLQYKVDVVVHQAKGMDAVAEAFGAFLKQQKQSETIDVSQKDILPGIAAQNDMIDSTREMNTRFAGHARRIAENPQLSIQEA